MKYVVVQDFRDRFSGMKIFRAGDTHEPQTEERAQQLLRLGFIVVDPETAPSKPEPARAKSKKTVEVAGVAHESGGA